MARKPIEVPQAIPVPDDLPLSDWLQAVKEASKTLRVPLPRRQAAAVRRISEGRPPKAGASEAGR